MSKQRPCHCVYRCVRFIGRPFRFHLVGLEHVRDDGPAIFVANHLRSLGPIQAILSMPLHFTPWVVRDMADYRLAPAYLYDDFVHPTWGLSGRAGRLVSAIVAPIAVTLIRAMGCISVDSRRDRVIGAFHRSLQTLSAGGNLLIFPEDPQQPAEAETGIRPFKMGFLALCGLYEKETGRRLPVYPLAVSASRRVVRIGAPLYYVQENGAHRQSLERMRDALYEAVNNMYRELEAGR